MPTITPMNDLVLVERVEVSNTTDGGIILPEQAKDKPTRGVVKAVGPGRRTKSGALVPLTVAVGDTVLFSSYAGTAIKDDKGDYLMVSEYEILAVVKDYE